MESIYSGGAVAAAVNFSANQRESRCRQFHLMPEADFCSSKWSQLSSKRGGDNFCCCLEIAAEERIFDMSVSGRLTVALRSPFQLESLAFGRDSILGATCWLSALSKNASCKLCRYIIRDTNSGGDRKRGDWKGKVLRSVPLFAPVANAMVFLLCSGVRKWRWKSGGAYQVRGGRGRWRGGWGWRCSRCRWSRASRSQCSRPLTSSPLPPAQKILDKLWKEVKYKLQNTLISITKCICQLKFIVMYSLVKEIHLLCFSSASICSVWKLENLHVNFSKEAPSSIFVLSL